MKRTLFTVVAAVLVFRFLLQFIRWFFKGTLIHVWSFWRLSPAFVWLVILPLAIGVAWWLARRLRWLD